MEQVEGGTLVVNSAAGEKPAAPEDDDDLRDLNLVDGLAEGWKLAEVRPFSSSGPRSISD